MSFVSLALFHMTWFERGSKGQFYLDLGFLTRLASQTPGEPSLLRWMGGHPCSVTKIYLEGDSAQVRQ